MSDKNEIATNTNLPTKPDGGKKQKWFLLTGKKQTPISLVSMSRAKQKSARGRIMWVKNSEQQEQC